MKKRLVVVLLLLLVASVPLNAQWSQTYGPYARRVNCFVASGTNVFAGTEDGILFSASNGISWTWRNSGLTNTTINAFAVSGTMLIAGTGGGGVFRSSNDGVGWSQSNTGLTDLVVTACAISGGNMFAGTGNGGVFLSTNSGANWVPVNTGLAVKSVVCFAVSGSNIFAGTAGGVFLSTNNGASWTSVGLTSDYVYALAVNGGTLLAGTYPGGVYRSSDNGASWSQVNTGLPSPLWVVGLAVSGTTLFAGTYSDGVFVSFNNGGSWAPVNAELTIRNVSSLAASGTYLFAGITGSGVYRRLISEMALPPAPAPASPADGAVNVSINLVLSWYSVAGALLYHLQLSTTPTFATTIIDDSASTTLSKVVGPLSLATTYFWRVRVKNDLGYSAFSSMRQFSTILSTSVHEKSDQVPTAFALNQNYPNPFNPSTIIHFELPRATNVSLKIFNTLGQVVATLLEEHAEAGVHQVQWEANVSSGMYFYRLEAREFVATKKMILLR